jgi:hypothetical protein
MMNLYTEHYEVVIIEQPSDIIIDGISPRCNTIIEARAFAARSPTLIDSCKYAIRKTVVSYLEII